ncbi:hypothetical protein [Halopiger djelfimassiliensis]|uniref:hypothetical protein n=1 Tax=Halopiger djelfimassiliensis TaxID=1293047 RepID=UPI0006780CF0|nr:hypothetical protein [Halopiger djelfimassiliensis]
MGSSELSANEGLRQPLTLRRVESVEPTASVRHVDQLETDTLEEFYAVVEAERSVLSPGTDLEAGDVIVFTEYYRVDRV